MVATNDSESLRNEAEDTSIGKRKVARPAAKFVIGFFAGLCSAFFPKLILVLNMSGESPEIIVFDPNYLLYALLFSILVGVAVMIIEWYVISEPAKTFMMALSIPALISGAFNSNSAFDLYKEESATAKKLQAQLEKQLTEKNPIPILPTPGKIQILSEKGDTQENRTSFYSYLTGVRKAYAANALSAQNKILAFKVKKQLFMIVLYMAQSKQDALERANELRRTIRQAQAAAIDTNQFAVILGGVTLPRSEALLEVIRLREQYRDLNLDPLLLPVPSAQ
jgi:hypothetical protein